MKTVEDLADLATDELRGAFESKNGEQRVRIAGRLGKLSICPVEDAEALILQSARVAAGWIEADPEPEVAEPEAEEVAEGVKTLEHEAPEV